MTSFGTLLHDQLPALYSTLSTYHLFFNDVANFYSSYAELTKQHSSNIRNLLKKSLLLRSKRVECLVAGDAPSKAFRDGDTAGRQHTLDSFYARLLASVDEEAQDRSNMANSFEQIVCEAFGAKFEYALTYI